MKALRDSVIFTFRETVRNGMFIPDEKIYGGIIVKPTAEDSGKTVRIVDVKFVGPDVKDVQVGNAVLVTPLMWSEEFKVDGKSYWRTEEQHIMAIVEK